tara:strand:+ start:501 stop:1829 length:1329 start_codon:yes stop_codon:yes gene_type:complete
MPNFVVINNKINPYNKKIFVDGDKSISIRWALLASQAIGKSKALNLPASEDISSTISCLKKLGIKVIKKNERCEIYGNGINGFKYKDNITIDAGNSGTCGRLILGLLVAAKKKVRLIGDESLSTRDFSRVTLPLRKFGARILPPNKQNLPISIIGSSFTKPINYIEKIGSAQCKSSVMLAALNAPGKTIIKAKKSRNHTELFFKNIKIPIKIKKIGAYDLIEIEGKKNFNSFDYNIPGDISSSAFFIVLTLMSKNSKLIIKNVNVNPTRIGCINILNKMRAGIKIRNKKNYKGEVLGDIYVKSKKKLKAINCPTNLNSSAIDEFLIIFLVASKATGVSSFKNISELNKKESPRLKIASKILNKIGIKTNLLSDSIKIYGNPNLKLSKKIIIKNFMKDHRVFMMSVIAALCVGGEWKIYDKNCVKTSFPSFFKIAKDLGAKII